MTKRSNNFKKVMAAILVAMIATVSGVSGANVGVTEVKAATYTNDNQSLSINNGMAILTVNGTETYQLTKSLVVKDGGFDKQGTVYLLWLSGTLFGYNYQLQGANTTLFIVDSGVISLTVENGYVTGYDTTSGHKTTLTLEQVKEKLNPSSGSNQSSGSQSGNQSGDQSGSQSGSQSGNQSGSQSGNQSGSQSGDQSGSQSGNQSGNSLNQAIVTEGIVVTYNDGQKNYILSTSKEVDQVITDSQKTVWIRYKDGSIYAWNYYTQKNDATVVLYAVTDSSYSITDNGYYNQSGFNAFPSFDLLVANNTKDVKVSNGTVTFKVNGSTYSFTAANVAEVYQDNEHNLWVRCTNGELYAWCYELQKGELNVKLYKVEANVTKLVAVDDKAIGYYVQGNPSIVAIKTTAQLKTLIEKENAANTVTTTTTTTTATKATKTTYAYTVVSKGYYKVLQNSKGKTVDKFRLKSGVFKYHGITLKSIKKAHFNPKGNVLVITTKGKLVVINHTTLKRKTIKSSGISAFNYSKRGLAIYAVRKTKTRFSVTKY